MEANFESVSSLNPTVLAIMRPSKRQVLDTYSPRTISEAAHRNEINKAGISMVCSGTRIRADRVLNIFGDNYN